MIDLNEPPEQAAERVFTSPQPRCSQSFTHISARASGSQLRWAGPTLNDLGCVVVNTWITGNASTSLAAKLTFTATGVADGYGLGYPMAVLADAVRKIAYPSA